MPANPGPLLAKIHTPADLKLLEESDLSKLCKEIRDFIIEENSVNPGHLGASLGAVELAVAIHYVYDTPFDRLIWDVGHQAYAHKIITGRREVFYLNRSYQGISGFPKREESIYDTFGTGHASTSISAALGMAMANKLKQENRHFIAVIGDAAIVGGMAMEGLNHAGASDADLLIVLNDNGIAIDKSAGAFSKYLTKNGKGSAGNFFKAFNLNYFGPENGHDVVRLVEELRRIKTIPGPKLLHAITTKGKGLTLAEKYQTRYHAPGPFDKETGELLPPYPGEQPPKYQHVFGYTLVELARINKKIVGITPAMPTGSSLNIMMEEMPERAFDVGIAEEHAVTFAAGLATEGMTPFCNIYSTFMQRAYDQVIHDVALQKLHVIFCLDRAGLVGEDGATHHGSYDLAYFRAIPGMTICSPMNEEELRNMMFTAQDEQQGTFAIRYPRNRGIMIDWKRPFTKLEIGKGRVVRRGGKIAVISIGHVGNNVVKASELLDNEGIIVSHYDIRFLKPIDEELLHDAFRDHELVITVEDGTINGGLGSAVLEFMADHGYNKKVIRLGIPDKFIEQGTIEELQHECGFDVEGIVKVVKHEINK